LEQHQIPALMEYLCAQLVYKKPADPASFLATELRALQSKQQAGSKALPSSALSLFNDDELVVMFGMLDPLNTGTLSAKQVYKAVQDLGLDPARAGVDPAVQQRFNVDAFKKACKAAQ
jgi:hypothetical protein